VDMTYFTLSRGATTNRQVNPYRILSREGHGYLVGWCHLRRDVLIFRMDRIRSVELTSDVFAIPSDFDLETFLGPMFGMFRDPDVFNVKVHFSPWVARWIREEVWHPSQRLTDLPGGHLQVDLTVTGLEDVKRWILGFGEHAEVLEPQRLRVEIREAITAMAEVYARLA
jgi:predicted DNA-binding transcriptional regulator YafY